MKNNIIKHYKQMPAIFDPDFSNPNAHHLSHE
jgi:hypothetical protein